MTNCLHEHSESCLMATNPEMPTRLLDVGPEDGLQALYLFLTNGQRGSWISLSHCWGHISRFVTDSQNLEWRQKSISLEDMPPTFRDAIIATRRLGQRYLWIDFLYILQDSRKDWAEESVRMGGYYKFGTLTIAPDTASDDHQGFLATLRPHQTTSKPVTIRIPGEDLHHIFVEAKDPMPNIK